MPSLVDYMPRLCQLQQHPQMQAERMEAQLHASCAHWCAHVHQGSIFLIFFLQLQVAHQSNAGLPLLPLIPPAAWASLGWPRQRAVAGLLRLASRRSEAQPARHPRAILGAILVLSCSEATRSVSAFSKQRFIDGVVPQLSAVLNKQNGRMEAAVAGFVLCHRA